MKRLFLALTITAAACSQATAQTAIPPGNTVNGVAIGTIATDAETALETTLTSAQSIVSPLNAAASDNLSHFSLFPSGATIGGSGIQGYISPNSLILGGLGLQNDGHLIVRGAVDGPDDMGTLVSIGLTNNNIAGSRAGVGPGPGGVETYGGGLDGVAMQIATTDTAPEFSAGQDFKSADGITHTVTYTATTAVITPALSTGLTNFIAARPSLNMMTNSTDGYVLPANYTTTLPIHTYAGQAQSITTNGNTTTVAVNYWSVPGSKTTGTPGTTYDTIRTNYPHAALFIGAITKAFPVNLTCTLGDEKDAGSSPNDFGNTNTQVRECGTEDDHFNNDTADYKQHFDGLVEVYSGLGLAPNTGGTGTHAVLPATDSHGFYCGGQWAVCFQAADGNNTDAFISNALNGYDPFGLEDQGTEAAGTSAPMGQFGGYTTSNQFINLVASMTKATTTTGWAGTEVDWCYYEGPQRQSGPSPNRQGCVAYNVGGVSGTVGLIGYGGAGLTVTPSGGISVSGNAAFQAPVSFPNYSYTALPTANHVGNEVECSNCLKPGESSGHGTGMMVFDDGHSHWVSLAGTVAAD